MKDNKVFDREQIVSYIRDCVFVGCEIVPHFESTFHEIVDKLDNEDLSKVLYDIRQDSPLYKTEAFWKLLKLSNIVCTVELGRLEGRYDL